MCIQTMIKDKVHAGHNFIILLCMKKGSFYDTRNIKSDAQMWLTEIHCRVYVHWVMDILLPFLT